MMYESLCCNLRAVVVMCTFQEKRRNDGESTRSGKTHVLRATQVKQTDSYIMSVVIRRLQVIMISLPY